MTINCEEGHSRKKAKTEINNDFCHRQAKRLTNTKKLLPKQNDYKFERLMYTQAKYTQLIKWYLKKVFFVL